MSVSMHDLSVVWHGPLPLDQLRSRNTSFYLGPRWIDPIHQNPLTSVFEKRLYPGKQNYLWYHISLKLIVSNLWCGTESKAFFKIEINDIHMQIARPWSKASNHFTMTTKNWVTQDQPSKNPCFLSGNKQFVMKWLIRTSRINH